MAEKIKVELCADNNIPAFAAYANFKGKFTDANVPKILINFQQMLVGCAENEMNAQDFKQIFSESVVHEILHMVQHIYDQVFSEEDVDDAIEQIREILSKENT